jgi:hypothetical protein
MKRCRISEIRADMPIKYARLMFNSKNVYLEEINRVIDENRIFLSRIHRKYLNVLKDTRKPTCTDRHTAIPLVPYIGVCLFCMSLLLIASLILFGEYAAANDFAFNKVYPRFR